MRCTNAPGSTAATRSGRVGGRPGVDDQHRQRRVVLVGEGGQRRLEEPTRVAGDHDRHDRRGALGAPLEILLVELGRADRTVEVVGLDHQVA